jgi:hypothetical protein
VWIFGTPVPWLQPYDVSSIINYHDLYLNAHCAAAVVADTNSVTFAPLLGGLVIVRSSPRLTCLAEEMGGCNEVYAEWCNNHWSISDWKINDWSACVEGPAKSCKKGRTQGGRSDSAPNVLKEIIWCEPCHALVLRGMWERGETG